MCCHFHSMLRFFLPDQPGHRLGLGHQDMVEHEHETVEGFVHDPRGRLEAFEPRRQDLLQPRKRGLCCHGPRLFPKQHATQA